MQGLLAIYAGYHCIWVAWRSDVASCSRQPYYISRRFHFKHMPLLCTTAIGARVNTSPTRLWGRKSKLPAAATLEGNAAEINAATKVVKVKFMLQRKCNFGQQFNIVGDDAQFGSWDPAAAIPMEWSEGHIWTTELDLSVGKRVEFKIILTGRQGELQWQPGPNRVLQVPEASLSLLISESWSGEKIPINIPPVQAIETTSPSNDEVFDALIVLHATLSEIMDETADIATQDSGVVESTQDTGGCETAENASDIFLISDIELPVKTDPEISEDPVVRRIVEDSFKSPEPKLSVLAKDLNWARQVLSNFWSVFKPKCHNEETDTDTSRM